MPYNYVTFGALKAALLQRLQDTIPFGVAAGVFTLDAEAGAYIIESLQALNALTAIWADEQLITFAPLPAAQWQSLDFTGSLRERTVTDDDLYRIIQYHLLEPPTGGTWTGTTQFNITDVSQALQYRRDLLLQDSGANVQRFTQASPTVDAPTVLPDTLLELRRVRWIPDPGSGISPYALWLEDINTANAYANNAILTPGEPESYMVTNVQPLQFESSAIPIVTGTWDILALVAGTPLAPPTPTILGLPNDWCWVAKWGALADLLNNSPEGFDRQRAVYCRQRYERGAMAMRELPWLLSGGVAGIPTDTPSFPEADSYAQNWEQVWPLADPQVVVGGVDLVTIAPNVLSTGQPVQAGLTVVKNAPVPTLDADPVQLSRDVVDAVLAYAQHLASFKMGGAEFYATLPLYQQFEKYCAATNARYAALGVYKDALTDSGLRGDRVQPRTLEQDEETLAIQRQAEIWREASR